MGAAPILEHYSRAELPGAAGNRHLPPTDQSCFALFLRRLSAEG
jgi:hypothetical protein